MKYTSFNELELVRQFRGDEEILLDLISIFQDDSGELVDLIKKSILDKDGINLRIHAHTFKGVLANFYADKAKRLAFELEKRGLRTNFEDAPELLSKLESEVQVFLVEIDTFKNHLTAKV